jgi:hypothetical protein
LAFLFALARLTFTASFAAFLAISERRFALNLRARSLPPSAPVSWKNSRTSFGSCERFFTLGPKVTQDFFLSRDFDAVNIRL